MSDKYAAKKTEGADEAWLVSYADLVSMLLAVFVVFFSMASANSKKTKVFTTAISKYLKTGKVVTNVDANFSKDERHKFAMERLAEVLSLGDPDQLNAKLDRILKDPSDVKYIKGVIKDIGLDGSTRIEKLVPRFEITLFSDGVFANGGIDLRPNTIAQIRKLAPALREATIMDKKLIEIEGHTDSSPIRASSRVKNNSHLSYLRAESIYRILAEEGVPPNRMRVVSYGSGRPLLPERLRDGRLDRVAAGKNRRVVISLFRDK